MDKRIYELGSWQLSVLLAGVECLLLLHSLSLPQHGDAAIGTAMVGGLAVVLFSVHLLVVTPFLVWRCVKLGHDFGTGADLQVFGSLAAGPVCFLLVLLFTSGRT